MYRVVYRSFAINSDGGMGTEQLSVVRTTISGITNQVHKILITWSKDLVSLEINTDGEWIIYDLDEHLIGDGHLTSYQAVLKKITEIAEFHQAFYEGLE
jgi:hypothetical protein